MSKEVDLELAQRMCNLLNELLANDPKAVQSLVTSRVPCSEQTANHPTIQVRVNEDSEYLVGILGILNGLCGSYESNGCGPVAAIFNEDMIVEGFKILTEEDYDEIV